MSNYILVYRYKGDDGTAFEEFDAESKLHARVNQLAEEFDGKLEIIRAGWLHTEYEYTPVVSVTKWEHKRV